ncbi:MAG: 50S ribosomal protein L13 [Candidatus Neomarinimicrobiota bacterium]|nr:MAG: 50S ribosomal protein L13 [Candidatus Neomarinimicrobiota bacterium]
MKTESIKQADIQRDWWIADAEGQTLGRFASRVATILRGKHKPNFTPHMDMGDFVVVVNADKIRVTGNKENQKTYFRHTGYPGGGKETDLAHMRRTFPERIVEQAVKGMLPHNRLGRQCFRHLKVYAGSEHPHTAQNPKPLEL